MAAFVSREAIDVLLDVRKSVSESISTTKGEVRSALWDVVRVLDGHLTELSAKKV